MVKTYLRPLPCCSHIALPQRRRDDFPGCSKPGHWPGTEGPLFGLQVRVERDQRGLLRTGSNQESPQNGRDRSPNAVTGSVGQDFSPSEVLPLSPMSARVPPPLRVFLFWQLTRKEATTHMFPNWLHGGDRHRQTQLRRQECRMLSVAPGGITMVHQAGFRQSSWQSLLCTSQRRQL